MKVYFKSASILRAVIRNIRSSERVYGCIAWVTHPKILDEMEKIPTELIMTSIRQIGGRDIKVKFMGSGEVERRYLCTISFGGFRGKKPAPWLRII